MLCVLLSRDFIRLPLDSSDANSHFMILCYLPRHLLTPLLFFILFTGLIGAFQEFTKFVIFSGGANGYTGGPGDSLLTLFPYIWEKGYEDNFLGLAIAMAFGLFVLIGIFTIINFTAQSRWVFYQEDRR